MRYSTSEKLEIIRLVAQARTWASSQPWTSSASRRRHSIAGMIATCRFGKAGLEDRTSHPGRVWNRIPDNVRADIIDLALEETELSPARAGRQVHRHQGLLRLGSLGLPAPQSPRPDYQPSLRRHQGCG